MGTGEENLNGVCSSSGTKLGGYNHPRVIGLYAKLAYWIAHCMEYQKQHTQ